MKSFSLEFWNFCAVVLSVYAPDQDMALGSVVDEEVDMTHDLRSDAFHAESLQSPHNDFLASGLLDEVIEQETVIDAKKRFLNTL